MENYKADRLKPVVLTLGLEIESNMKRILSKSEIALLVILATLTFYPLFSIGYTTADDVYRHLEVLSGGALAASSAIAESTGRFGLNIHIFIAHAPYLFNSVIYQKIFLIAPHVVVISLFYVLLNKFSVGREASLLFMVLFLCFFTNSWDHNLYASYPFAFHFSIAAIIISTYYLKNYIDSGARLNLALSSLAYFAAIFSYEQFLAYIVFFALLVIYYSFVKQTSWKWVASILTPYVLITAIYLATFMVYRAVTNGSYDGTSLATNDVSRFFRTLFVFTSSAFPLYIPFNYFLRIHNEINGASYSISALALNVVPIWIVKSLVASWLVLKISDVDGAIAGRRAIFIAVSLLALVMLSVLLISLSTKYQGWVVDSGALAYSSSSFVAQLCAAAFIAVVTVGLMNTNLARKNRKLTVLGLLVLLSLIVLVTETNNSIVLSQQMESRNKWLAIELLSTNGVFNNIPENSVILAPDFVHTGGIVNVGNGYWGAYLNMRHGVKINIIDNFEDLYSPMYSGKRYVLKYYSSYPHRNFAIFLQALKIDDQRIIIPEYEITGFYGIEHDEQGREFRWSKNNSSLFLCNGASSERPLIFSASINTDAPRSEPLLVSAFGRINQYPLDNKQVLVVEKYDVTPGCHAVTFQTKAPPVMTTNETRKLFFVISEWKVTEASL